MEVALQWHCGRGGSWIYIGPHDAAAVVVWLVSVVVECGVRVSVAVAREACSGVCGWLLRSEQRG